MVFGLVFLLVQVEMMETQWEEVEKCDVGVGPGVVLYGVYEKKKKEWWLCYFLCFFLKQKLVHKVGLCFGLSSSSQWISPLFIRVERKVWDVYLDSWPLIQMEKILSLAKSEHHKLLKLGCTSWSSCCLWDGAATPTKTTTQQESRWGVVQCLTMSDGLFVLFGGEMRH